MNSSARSPSPGRLCWPGEWTGEAGVALGHHGCGSRTQLGGELADRSAAGGGVRQLQQLGDLLTRESRARMVLLRDRQPLVRPSILIDARQRMLKGLAHAIWLADVDA